MKFLVSPRQYVRVIDYWELKFYEIWSATPYSFLRDHSLCIALYEFCALHGERGTYLTARSPYETAS
jgi:hypothetical protein